MKAPMLSNSQNLQLTTSTLLKMKDILEQTHLKTLNQDFKTKVCLKRDLRPDDWIVDSGCTKHMTGNIRLFTSYKEYDDGNVVFRSNLKGKVFGRGHLCDDNEEVKFTKVDCTISKNSKTLAKGHRRNGLYTYLE
ncbi:hypothetical protein Tco_0663618, partial [Tanacetum coccineum]